MPAQKYPNTQIGIIARYALCRGADGAVYGRTWGQVNEKYPLSPSTLGAYIRKAVKLMYISEKERQLRAEATYKKGGFYSFVKKHGKRTARKMCKAAWDAGIGKATLRDIKKWSRKGGQHAHKYSPHVTENLDFSGDYGVHFCFYKGVEYHSQIERRVATLLSECGLVDRIKPEKNFQKKYGKYTLDFLIETEEGNLGIEIHPEPKKHSGITQSFADYARKRPGKLKKQGFEGTLIVAKNPIDLFDKLSDKGLAGKYGIPLTFAEYQEKLRAADKKLRGYDLRHGIQPKPKRKKHRRKTVAQRREQEKLFRERQKAIQKANKEDDDIDVLPE